MVFRILPTVEGDRISPFSAKVFDSEIFPTLGLKVSIFCFSENSWSSIFFIIFKGHWVIGVKSLFPKVESIR